MGQFALDIAQFGEKAMDRADLIMRKVALELDQLIVLRTPVDTGRARANWQVGINNVDLTVEKTDDLSGAQAFQKAIRNATRKLTRQIQITDVIYISNNVDYIEYLEKGSSDQAPHGMLAVTLRDFPGIVEKGTREAKREIP